MNWKETLFMMVAGVVRTGGAEALADLFMKMKPIDSRKTFLVSFYPVVDVELEKLAAETKTKIDDTIVQAVKTSLEIAAEKTGVLLPNLDTD